MFFDTKKINDLLQTTKEVGELIMSHYHKNTEFEVKDDDTPITELDLLAHDFLVAKLNKITPNINIISEEDDIVDFEVRKKWDEYWLIDPLDGTKGYIDKTDDFCICLAYIKYNEPIFGLIYDPVKEIHYIANARDTACKITNNKKYQLQVKKPHKPLRVVVGKNSANSTKVLQHLDRVVDNKNYTITGIGSALKFCLIADGKFDYYPALGTCSEWDSAAGNFILSAAGGHIIDFYDNILKYNTKKDLLSPIFFASGDFIISRTN
jgi:3'(2'), 5'-bisphosphate nucleotidase